MTIDFTEYNNEHLGDLTLLSGIAAIAQRKMQIEGIQKQNELLQSHLQSQQQQIRNEAERLAIERQRLELERQERELHEEQTKRLKDIRNFLADTIAALDALKKQSP